MTENNFFAKLSFWASAWLFHKFKKRGLAKLTLWTQEFSGTRKLMMMKLMEYKNFILKNRQIDFPSENHCILRNSMKIYRKIYIQLLVSVQLHFEFWHWHFVWVTPSDSSWNPAKIQFLTLEENSKLSYLFQKSQLWIHVLMLQNEPCKMLENFEKKSHLSSSKDYNQKIYFFYFIK